MRRRERTRCKKRGKLRSIALLVAACAGAMQIDVAQGQETPVDTISEANQLPSGSELDEIYQRFMYTTEDGLTQFDVEAAEDSGVEPIVLQLGEDINEMALYEYRSERGLPQNRGVFDVNRWNWCGKNNSGPAYPANEADQICQNHDFCLAEAHGDPNKEVACDRQFVSGMRAVRDRFGGEDRWYIEKAIALISATPLCRQFGC